MKSEHHDIIDRMWVPKRQRPKVTVWQIVLWVFGMAAGIFVLIKILMNDDDGSGVLIYYRQRCPDDQGYDSQINTSILLDVSSNYKLSSPLGGMAFINEGHGKFVLGNITTSILHAFSPKIDERARKFYVIGARDLMINVIQPTIAWHNDQLVTVLRFWINNAIFTMGDNLKQARNKFSDNNLYVQRFGRTMEPFDDGSLVGMVGPKHNFGDGPINPRLFIFNGKLFLSFTLKYQQTNANTYTNGFFLWDFEEHVVIKLKIKGLRQFKQPLQFKDCIPLISKGELYFVCRLDPLRVLKCKLRESKCMCGFVMFEGDTYKPKVNKEYIRGGTPFTHYRDSYHISIGYSTFKKPSMKKYFTANLVIMRTEQKPRIVYVSAPLRINNTLLVAYPILRHWYSEDPFFVPFGIILENLDSLVISAHINEHSSVLIRLGGIQSIIEKVIELDERHKATDGVQIGSVQTFVKKAAAKREKTLFL